MINDCSRLLLFALGILSFGFVSAQELMPRDRYGDLLPEGALLRLGTARLRHQGPVLALAYSPDGKILASGDANGTVRLWEASTGREIRKLDKSIFGKLDNSSYGAQSLAFTPDGTTLATNDSHQGTVSLWEVATGQKLGQFEGQSWIPFPNHAVAISPDGKLLAVANVEKAVRLWEMATGKEVRRLEGPQSPIASVAFTPDGKILASGGTSGPDQLVRLWDVGTGKEIQKLTAAAPFAFTHDGKALAGRLGYSALCLWDVATGKVLREIVNEKGYPMGPMAFSQDGRLLARVDAKTQAICLWDTEDWKEIRRWAGGIPTVKALAFAPDGKTLASGGNDRLVHLWDVTTGREFNPWIGHRWGPFSVACFPDGGTVASASSQEVLLWDPTTGREIQSLPGASPIAVAPDGKILASGSAGKDDFAIILWDLATGRPLRRCVGHQNHVHSLTFSPDGRHLATGSWDQTVRLWDVATGKETRQYRGHGGALYAVAFSPDSKVLASSSHDKTIRLWDSASGKEIRQLGGAQHGTSALAFSPDSRLLASGSSDKAIHLWEASTGQEIRQLHGHQTGVKSLAFSPDGRMLVSGGYEGTVRCWELVTGQEVLPPRGEDFLVNAVAFAPDGRTILSGSSDTTAMIWDVTGRMQAVKMATVQRTPPELEAHWTDLASTDGRKGHTAFWALIDQQGVALLKERLRPVRRVAPERLKRLVADLDSEEFAVRSKATNELEYLGELGTAALRQALVGQPTLELRRRVEQLLAQAEDATRSPERLRTLRAVGVLEQAGTAEACRVLARLAEGAEDSRLTQEARAALARRARFAPAVAKGLFAEDNLVAWCIVPFDARKRSPEDRAAMLKRLGFKRYAYDWRAEHLPTFEREIEALKKNGVELTAVWFPGGLNADARVLLAALKKHEVKTQLWVSMNGGGVVVSPEEQKKRIETHAAAIRLIAEEAAKIGCTVALYNHGGWFGEPENQLAILNALKLSNVGIVYNLHHGHDHLDRFPELLRKMKPHLFALNLNGMIKDGDRKRKKILPLGQGDLDLSLLKAIRESGWSGPIGILGHTNDDAEERLKDNLDGLRWLLPQLDGKGVGVKPAPRTMSAATPAGKPTPGWLAEGKPEYRTPPLTVECRVKLAAKTRYNILVACDTKQSAAHWELFTTPANGHLTAYLPGLKPDHLYSRTDIADGKWHIVTMQYQPDRVRLFVDGKKVAETEVTKAKSGALPGGLAFARLVEGGLGCDGELAWVHLSRGIAEPLDKEPAAEMSTLGLWKFGAPDKPAEDLSSLKNPAKVASTSPAGGPKAVVPPPGVQLRPIDSKLKAVLIDRSPDDAYMAVKADGAGRLFVGGREAVFVFEPDGRGGFQPRRELLRFPPDSIIIGLEYRGDDLYVLTVNALYVIPGGRTRRDNLRPKRLLWGVPQDLHVSFHCLAWGPEGALYLNHGDPLLNYGDWSRPDHWGHWTLYTGPSELKVPYTGSGAVLRIQPDGSGLRVVARGLRGPVGLAFDQSWELFTNDNDHESMADRYAPARLLHVTPHADFSWPRGWMASKSPDRADLLEPVSSAMGRGVPVDLAFYDEALFPDLRGCLLLCRWDRFAVTRFPLRPRGATYAADEATFLVGDHNARPTGITVDRTGRVFVTCHYLGGNVVSPHCVSDIVMITREETPAEVAADETTFPTERLWATLSGSSGEARRRVHMELLRRGRGEIADALRRLNAVRNDDPALAHLPWLVAFAGGKDAVDTLVRMARNYPRGEIRLQAVRALAEYFPVTPPRQLFLDALADTSDAVKLAALVSFFDAPYRPPVESIARLATSIDPYLRQTASTLLARRATVTELEQLARADDAPTRLAAVLAAGIRLTAPPVHEPAPQGVTLHYPAGNAFFHRKLQFADRTDPVDLADLGPVGSYTTAQWWKTVKPSAEQAKLFDLLAKALDDPSSPVKSQAVFYLGFLRDARTEPGVDRVTRELRGGGLSELPPTAVHAGWLAGPFPDGKQKGMSEHPPEGGPIDLAAEYPIGEAKVGWRMVKEANGRLPWSAPAETSTFAYFRVQSRSRQPALLTATAAGTIRIWHNGRIVVTPVDGSSVLLDLQPGSNDVLIRIAGNGPLSLGVRAKERVTPEAPEKADGALLAERLKAGGAKVGPEFLTLSWDKEARTGDAERGRKLFGSLGCARCHAITPDQAGGGAPSLADVGRRFTPAHLVESILTPDKQVAAEFRTTVLMTTNGQVLSGLLVRETATELELLLPDTSHRVVKTANVEERRLSASSPMPSGLVRTPAELRDLLTYLLSDRPAPP